MDSTLGHGGWGSFASSPSPPLSTTATRKPFAVVLLLLCIGLRVLLTLVAACTARPAMVVAVTAWQSPPLPPCPCPNLHSSQVLTPHPPPLRPSDAVFAGLRVLLTLAAACTAPPATVVGVTAWQQWPCSAQQRRQQQRERTSRQQRWDSTAAE